VVGDLRHRQVVGVDVLGELRVVEPVQAVVKAGYGEGLLFQAPAQPTLAEPTQDSVAFGEQGEVANLVIFIAEPADDLGEVSGSTSVIGTMIGPWCLCRARSSTSWTPCRQLGRSWKSPRRSGGSMRCRPKPTCSVADDAARQPPVQFVER
jgi:hypothetical protein